MILHARMHVKTFGYLVKVLCFDEELLDQVMACRTRQNGRRGQQKAVAKTSLNYIVRLGAIAHLIFVIDEEVRAVNQVFGPETSQCSRQRIKSGLLRSLCPGSRYAGRHYILTPNTSPDTFVL